MCSGSAGSFFDTKCLCVADIKPQYKDILRIEALGNASLLLNGDGETELKMVTEDKPVDCDFLCRLQKNLRAVFLLKNAKGHETTQKTQRGDFVPP